MLGLTLGAKVVGLTDGDEVVGDALGRLVGVNDGTGTTTGEIVGLCVVGFEVGL